MLKVVGECCTGMNVYPAHKFLNGLNGLKRGVKRPKTIPGRPSTLKTDDNVDRIANVTEVLDQLTEADFQHCFEQ
ncbi:hypothetical protein NQ318_011597 [Aromia moschata]|uniref:Uncharacterized protein n=1 Tax=Aromia moschata TaxID=1265417 RepID=A0AAV8Z6Z7_9CUCU|nr:hypothetical protein NQ318_011597 [Aromia moschata]